MGVVALLRNAYAAAASAVSARRVHSQSPHLLRMVVVALLRNAYAAAASAPSIPRVHSHFPQLLPMDGRSRRP